MAELGTVEVQVRANLDQLIADFGQAHQLAQQLGASVQANMQQVQQANIQAGHSAGDLLGIYGKLKLAIAGAIGVAGIAGIGRLAGAYTDLNSRLINLVGSQEKASAVMERLQIIARRTYTSITQTTESFLYNSRALRELGFSTQKQLDFSESLNNAMVVSGARAQRAASVQLALSKAISLGRLQGNELNTVMSMGGRIAELLADELGVTTNELKRLGSEGKITTKVISDALIGNLETLRKEADAMPATIADAFVLMGNAVSQFIGITDRAGNITGSLATKLVSLADAIAGAAQPAANLLRATINLLTGSFESMGVSAAQLSTVSSSLFTSALGGGAVLAVRALAVVIGVRLVGAFAALNRIMRANPIMLIASAIAVVVPLVFKFRDQINQALGTELIGTARGTVNKFIGMFRAMFIDVSLIFSSIGPALQAANVAALNSIKRMINDWAADVTGIINDLIGKINSLTSSVGGVAAAKLFGLSGQIPMLEPPKKFGLEMNEAADELATMWEDRGERIRNAMETDYLGAISQVLNATTDLSAANKELDGSTKDLTDEFDPKATAAAKKLADAYRDIVGNAKTFIQAQELEREVMGMSEVEANKLRYAFDLLNEARGAGIVLTNEKTAELVGLAATMAETEGAVNRLHDAMEFSRDIAKGFVSDLRAGLQEGEGFFASFANAAVGALQRITDKLIDMALDAMINMVFKSLLGGIGGGGGGLFAGGLGPAIGSFRGAQALHSGGIAGRSPTTRGLGRLSANEVPAILRKGEPVFQSMAHARSAVGSDGPIQLTVNVAGARGNAEIEEMVTRGVRSGLGEYDRRTKRRQITAS